MTFENWSSIGTNTDTTPLTAESLEKALRDIDKQYWEREASAVERATQFIESVPERLRRHPLVVTIEAIIVADQPIHPKTHENLKARYETLLAEDHTVVI